MPGRQINPHWMTIALILVIPSLTLLLFGQVRGQDDPGQPSRIQERFSFPDQQANRDADAREPAASIDWSVGETPKWIWGPDADQTYDLSTTFEGPVERAVLIASCDNEMTVWINEQRVIRDDRWEDANQKDVTEWVVDGENTLRVRAQNHGGIAGFVGKLRLWSDDLTFRDVVTSDTWRCTSVDLDQPFEIQVVGSLGDGPWGNVLTGGQDDVLPEILHDVFLTRPGFQVELLYEVDKETQGSWVAFTFDDQGRIIASDQGDRGLWRVTPGSIGTDEPTVAEKIDLPISAAQGLLYAFDHLYVSVNGGPGSGFYRLSDSDGDDQFDELDLLKPLRGGGEHGPHALRLSPDGQQIFLIAGNHTDPPADFDASRVPQNWSEDLLLPRQWDARGHARGKLAPGGWIAVTDPDGQKWEMYSVGYRNPYDMDFNADGELFAYDADMEWDMGASWYRPTRVVHVTSGSEFGWRSGTGKWPSYFADSLPAAVDIGPGSPTGVCFGTGARFPAAYQRAMFLCDWTFGTLYAIHYETQNGSYVGTKEEFVSRSPLPLTDVEVGPDGALYFTVGGRGTNSALYRVTYVGDANTDPVDGAMSSEEHMAELERRRGIEQHHDSDALNDHDFAHVWDHLASGNRHTRYAARVALEHQPVDNWMSNFNRESDPQTILEASIAVARQGDAGNREDLLDRLNSIDIESLTNDQRLQLARAYSLAFIRLGAATPAEAESIGARLDPFFPVEDDRINQEWSRLLTYLEWPGVIDKTLALMEASNEQRQHEVTDLLARNRGYGQTIAQMLINAPDPRTVHYALVLRNLKFGWTLEQRQHYFVLLDELAQRSGGASYQGFIQNIRDEALANCLPAERDALASSLQTSPPAPESIPEPIGPGREWQVSDVAALADQLRSDRDFESGKRTYLAAECANCHRFAGEGGSTGPDLTNVAGRFGLRDLAEALIEPDKVISDQYEAHIITTIDGEVFTGRVLSESDDSIEVLFDPVDISKIKEIARDDIEDLLASPKSLMPSDLLNELNEDELLDLLAFLLSRGNDQHPYFQSAKD